MPDNYSIILLRSDTPSWGMSLSVENGGITFIYYGCGESPADIVMRMSGAELLLPPP
jgi:hypothetical protein